MKKVLFGIFAVSMVAFAVNPGVPGPNPGEETASVPVRVKAELVNAPSGLTITDETGVALQELVIDHGKLAINNVVGDSVAFKDFKVVRYSSTTPAELEVIAGANGGKLTIGLDDNTTTLRKGGVSDTEQLVSDITLAGAEVGKTSYEVPLNGGTDGEKEVFGKVTSVIANGQFNTATNTNIVAGLYHNSAERLLTVTYKAN